jgi:hypothetical protein
MNILWYNSVDRRIPYTLVNSVGSLKGRIPPGLVMEAIMTANLQTLIHSAEKLTPMEQVELINAISNLLYRHYQQEPATTSFWQPQAIESIVASQQTQPVSDVSALKANFWPEDESVDDFIEYVEQQRQDDHRAH